MNNRVYKFSEQDAIDFAKEQSKEVIVRMYYDGNSRDVKRDATKAEAKLVERAIASALFAIRNGCDVRAAKTTAEYFVGYKASDAEYINSYDSVYNKIDDFLFLKG